MADGFLGDISQTIGPILNGPGGISEQMGHLVESAASTTGDIGHILEGFPIDAHMVDPQPHDTAQHLVEAMDAIDAQNAQHLYDAVHEAPDDWTAHADAGHADVAHVDAAHAEPVAHDVVDVAHDGDAVA